MISLYRFKTSFQNLFRPLSRLLVQAGITANQVTIATITLSSFTGVTIALTRGKSSWLIIVPIFLFVRVLMNTLDGMMAREHNMKSAFGMMLNELGDMLSDIFLYAPLYIISGVSAPLLLAVLFSGILSEVTGLFGVMLGASRRFDGPLGKSDRAFAFGFLVLLIACGVKSGAWVNVYLGLMFILSVLTILTRFKATLREVKAR